MEENVFKLLLYFESKILFGKWDFPLNLVFSYKIKTFLSNRYSILKSRFNFEFEIQFWIWDLVTKSRFNIEIEIWYWIWDLILTSKFDIEIEVKYWNQYFTLKWDFAFWITSN